jgi:glycine reductase complex component B subunit gamma
MANLVSIAKTVGANRIVPTVAIPYPLGDPHLSVEDQWKLRKYRVGVALECLETPVEEATIFDVKF